MGRDWKRRLEGLQDQLKVLDDADAPQIRHGMVLCTGAPPADLESLHPALYSSCQHVLERVEFQISQDVRQVHYLFADYADDSHESRLLKFKELLRSDPPILEAVPAHFATRGTLPLLADGLQDSFVRWMLVLYSLSNRPDQNVIKSEIEFAFRAEELGRRRSFSPQIGDKSGMREWNEFSPLPDFDVLQLLTMRCQKNQDFAYWRTKYQPIGEGFPAVIAASLTKPIVYASINAIDLILRASELKRLSTSKIYARGKNESETRIERICDLVVGVLRAHHGTLDDKMIARMNGRSKLEEPSTPENQTSRSKDKPVYTTTALKQGAIAETLNTKWDGEKLISQSDVSKAMAEMFRRFKFKNTRRSDGKEKTPMEIYKGLCDLDRIVETLEAFVRDKADPATAITQITMDSLKYDDEAKSEDDDTEANKSEDD